MSTINGKSFQDPRNINLKGGATGSGLIRWSPPKSGAPALWSSNPFSTDDYGLYINSSNKLVFSSLGSITELGAAGGGGATPSWETLFASDKTFQLAGTTWTIDNNTGDNDVLTLTNSGAGSGDIIQITNAGSGKDINGTAGTWSVTKAGAAVFVSLTVPAVTTASGNLTLSAAGAGQVILGANTNTITVAKAATFSSTITVSDGLTDLISTANNAAALRVTNNTATTLGAGVADLGVVVIRSTSLTTGTLLKLQTDTTLTTGYYIECYDTDDTAVKFSVGEDGATIIAGVASGTTALTITAGDFVVTSGHVIMTAGNLTLTSGNAVLTAGNLTLTNGTFTITAGHAVLTAGNLTLTLGNAILTAGNLTLTKGDALLTEGHLTLTKGNIVVTAGNITNTLGNLTLTAGNFLITLGDATLTDGDLLLSSGNVTLTSGNIVVTAGNATLTNGNLLLTAGNITVTLGNLILTAGDATLTDGDLTFSANASKVIFTGTGANGGVLKNLKNGVAGTLGGTALNVEIDIGGTPYYFAVYPTKS